MFQPGKGPNGGDENGRDDFACEEREQPIIRPLVHRAGLRALLVNSGRIRVGDVVEDLGPAQLIDVVAAEPDLVER